MSITQFMFDNRYLSALGLTSHPQRFDAPGTFDARRLITGDKFIAGLLGLGIVDRQTCKVTITAEVGEPITLDVEKFGDDRLLQIVGDGHVVIAHKRSEAVAT